MGHRTLKNIISTMRLCQNSLEQIAIQYKDKNKGKVFAKNVAYWSNRFMKNKTDLQNYGKGEYITYRVVIEVSTPVDPVFDKDYRQEWYITMPAYTTMDEVEAYTLLQDEVGRVVTIEEIKKIHTGSFQKNRI